MVIRKRRRKRKSPQTGQTYISKDFRWGPALAPSLSGSVGAGMMPWGLLWGLKVNSNVAGL